LPRKTDSNKPADWLWIAESDLEALRVISRQEVGFPMCQSKLAEVLEKVLKAELLRQGWFLEKTHDLLKLAGELDARKSDLISQVRPLAQDLASLYFTSRYPGFDLDDPDWPTLRQQIESVSRLLATIQGRLPSAAG
jgi:HEPN domain-containing protein